MILKSVKLPNQHWLPAEKIASIIPVLATGYKEKWSASSRGQRNRIIKFLQEVIEDLQKQDSEETEEHARRKGN